MKLRKAIPEDIKSFLNFKEFFPMPKETKEDYSGFLMGSSESSYQHFVEHDIVWILENTAKELVGYSIVLCNETLRNSAVWNKRKYVDWGVPSLENKMVCFFEQLAVLPERRYRSYGKNLGIQSLADAFKKHAYAITTVVSSPVRNLASRGFVLAAGFKYAGVITEDYPHLKNVSSDVFVMSKEDFIRQMQGKYKSLAKKILDPNQADDLFKS